MLTIEFDDREYFLKFCEEHGDPVNYGDRLDPDMRLLFRDGWMYHGRSHSGPEWPPPRDPLERLRLRIDYWLIRRDLVRREVVRLTNMLTSLEEMSACRSVPLQIRVRTEHDGVKRVETIPLDLDLVRIELEHYRGWKDECERTIKELIDEGRRIYLGHPVEATDGEQRNGTAVHVRGGPVDDGPDNDQPDSGVYVDGGADGERLDPDPADADEQVSGRPEEPEPGVRVPGRDNPGDVPRSVREKPVRRKGRKLSPK